MKQKNSIIILLGNQIDYEKIEKLIKKKEKFLLKEIILFFMNVVPKIILILVNQFIY